MENFCKTKALYAGILNAISASSWKSSQMVIFSFNNKETGWKPYGGTGILQVMTDHWKNLQVWVFAASSRLAFYFLGLPNILVISSK